MKNARTALNVIGALAIILGLGYFVMGAFDVDTVRAQTWDNDARTTMAIGAMLFASGAFMLRWSRP